MIIDLLNAAIETIEANDPGQHTLLNGLQEFRDGCISARKRFEELSDSQFEVALCVAKGLTDRQVCEAVGKCHNTAYTTRVRVFRAMGVDSAAQLAVLAYRAGLLGEGEP